MDSIENAVQARINLNGFQILHDGTRLKVSRSKQEHIQLQEQNDSGVDYQLLQKTIFEKKIQAEIDSFSLDHDLFSSDPTQLLHHSPSAQQSKDQIPSETTANSLNASSSNLSSYQNNSSNSLLSPTTSIEVHSHKFNRLQLKSTNPSKPSTGSTSIFNNMAIPKNSNGSHSKNDSSIGESPAGKEYRSNSNQQQQQEEEGSENEEEKKNEEFPNNSSNNLNFVEVNLAKSVYESNVEKEQHIAQKQQLSNSNSSLGSHSSPMKRHFNKPLTSSQYYQHDEHLRTSLEQSISIQQQSHVTQSPLQTFSATSSTKSNGSPPFPLKNSSQTSQKEIYDSVDENTVLADFVPLQFTEKLKKSRVIYVNRVDGTLCTMNQIFNLFSAFGNIVKIIFMRTKMALLIEYMELNHAILAKTYLHDTVFQGQELKIYFSQIYDKIFFKDEANKPEGDEYFETPETLHRFKDVSKAQIHPPIDTLHVSNLSRDSCKIPTLKSIFDPFGKIQNVLFSLGENNNNMAYVQFQNSTIATLALANTHNTKINKRSIKVSFSKSKLSTASSNRSVLSTTTNPATASTATTTTSN